MPGFSPWGLPLPLAFLPTSWGLPSIWAEETVNDAASCLYLLCNSGDDCTSPSDVYPLDQPRARTLGFWDPNIFYCIRVILANRSNQTHTCAHTHTHTHTHACVSPSCPSHSAAEMSQQALWQSLCTLLLNHVLSSRE